jgi:hypothetical protein
VFQATFVGVFFAIGGFKIVANAVSFGIYCSGLAQLTIQGKCEFNTVGGGTGVHIAAHGGFVLIVADYTISASASAHYKLWSKGLIEVVAVTITLTGTPAWGNAFAYCYGVSVLDVEAVPTFSGSATGTRYNVQWNGFIDTLGAGSTYLPGNSAGIAVNGGLYL